MKKRLFSTLLALCMVLVLWSETAQAISDPDFDSCGEDATWDYDVGTKTLTISGSGEIVYWLGVENMSSVHYQALKQAEKIVFNGNFTAIGKNGLREFSSLKEITIPASVTKIGEEAFSGCSNLTSITFQNGVKYIDIYAFSGCSKLTNISIPASVIRIGGSANEVYTTFSGCTNLTEIVVDPQNTEYSSQDGALFTKEKDTLLFCPQGKTSFTISDSVSTIGASAFRGCIKLTAITVPDSVDAIGMWAFQDCTSLKTVNFPNKISTSHHYYTSMSSMFSGCTSLTEIAIPEGVKSLDRTFTGCSSLETVHLPVSLTSIIPNTFYDCFNLKNIEYAGSETQWGSIVIDGNPEIGRDKVDFTFLNQSTPSQPDNPNTPDTTPGILSLSVTDGGLGKKVTVTVEAGHWLTIQTRRAGSISLTSVRAPGSNSTVTLAFSAAAGSSIQVWETAEELTFVNGVPTNPILATGSQSL